MGQTHGRKRHRPLKDRPKPARWWNKCKQPKRVLAERLVPKLERWRGEIWADLWRYGLILDDFQPPTKAPKAVTKCQATLEQCLSC
ncbi:MAG: hypothetical protein EBT85_05755 [Synechococcaceae bacterium WB5_2B_268]|nr:hypothetical protein [Synechococcaceae bacterium WB5_2B_268]